ncbi:hypothetical protein HYW75_04140 [Candidatus Pacearchaeota archaeon]|nr:hypothetical protein [Candidatus Pacearchaeota archaeon]
MENVTLKKSLIIFLAITILVILVFLVLKNSNSPTGKVISENVICTDSDGTDSFSSQGTVTLKGSDGSSIIYSDSCEGSETVDYVCEDNRAIKHLSVGENCVCQNGACIPVQCFGNECNPSNTKQICSQGNWINCAGESICYANSCITPSKANAKIIGGGGSGDSGSGGGSGTTSSSSTASTETTRTIGNINTANTEEISINEKIIFLINGNEHNLKVTSLSSTLMNAELDGGSFSLEVGGEKRTDFNNDGIKDLSLILKSISLTTNKARLLITVF